MTTNYSGNDKRREQRRKVTDRRSAIRFEPDREDRRKTRGRRKTDKDIWSSDKSS